MSEELKKPYDETVKKQKEEYLHEMEAYNQKKAEEAEILRLEEDEQMKIHKQEALQILKKKEKTENIIKKTKENQQKKKKLKGETVVDPNKPKRPASSFILFSKEARKKLVLDRKGISNVTVNALISVKWKEMGEEEKKIWNDQAAEAMESYKKELEEYNKSVAAANNLQA
ncbi:hypothetical protein MKX01_004987 [Papaver californicum]|nr:hypothetical protein MKX01_004987 [Papaver californicum]